jgi:hypothetical protein
MVDERMNGLGAIVASSCLKALAGLMAVIAALAALLSVMQLFRGEPATQVALLALALAAGGIGSWWLGGVFARLAKQA